jgi:hypothetical protein
MRLDRSIGLPLVIVILGSCWSPARAGDSAAESALKAKGLTKVGHTFVLEEAEKPVLAKIKEIRGVYASYAAVAEKQAAAEELVMQSAQLDQQRVELQVNLNMLNQQIASTPNSSYGRGRYNMPQTPANNPLMAQRAQINATIAEIGQTQRVLKSQAPQPKDKSALDEDVKKKLDVFKLALADLRKDVDEVTKKYTDLGEEATVKKSVDDLVKASKAKVNLGPSDTLLAGMKELDRAERQYLGKKTSAASKKKTAKTKK